MYSNRRKMARYRVIAYAMIACAIFFMFPTLLPSSK
nr:MAG TPA: hypothetical protein [Caudoviricetes sp.]